MSSSSGLAAGAAVTRRLDGESSARSREARPSEHRVSSLSRVSRSPGMSFGHELLLAVIMAVAMAATVSLYR